MSFDEIETIVILVQLKMVLPIKYFTSKENKEALRTLSKMTLKLDKEIMPVVFTIKKVTNKYVNMDKLNRLQECAIKPTKLGAS
jgi:hypothetical protein